MGDNSTNLKDLRLKPEELSMLDTWEQWNSSPVILLRLGTAEAFVDIVGRRVGGGAIGRAEGGVAVLEAATA